jgi:hypothetical protein
MEIENEGLFRNALMHGINLFLGAGFSLSAYSLSKDGRQQIPLPKGDKLRDELVEHFNLGHFSKLNLPQLSQVLTTQFREEFYSYLTRCFTVSSFHPSYKNPYHPSVFQTSHSGGKGRQAWRILTMRRMPRVNQEVLPRATFPG